MKKTYLAADEYLHDIWRLAAQIRGAEWRPDILIGLWRGGAPAAIAVHEYLKVSGWDVAHMPLKSVSYTGIGQSGDVEFIGGEAVFGALRPGMRVLVVDDVFDTGKTAAALFEKVARYGVDTKLACVYWKSCANTTSLKPDYFVRDTGGDWIVFPHEIDGLAPDEIREKDALLAGFVAETSR